VSSSKKQRRKEQKALAFERRNEARKEERAKLASERKRKLEVEWESLTEEQRATKSRINAEARAGRQARKDEHLKKWSAAYAQGPRVLIDMNFDDKMNDKEVKSICQQLMYSWSVIKRSDHPIQLSVCGLTPGTRVHHTLMSKAGIDQWQMPITGTPFHEAAPNKEQIVYLTADSDCIVNTLEPDKVYVIGGLVDRNRHKGITLQLAKAHHCSHGRLPLQEFLDLKKQENQGHFSKILTVNHMVDVLTKYHETKDWLAAFLHAIPSRKNVRPGGDDVNGANGQGLEQEGTDGKQTDIQGHAVGCGGDAAKGGNGDGAI
jgi:tRNA (guanine9-N1)-methyltransferase